MPVASKEIVPSSDLTAGYIPGGTEDKNGWLSFVLYHKNTSIHLN